MAGTKRVREQVMVYLTSRDRELLEQLVEETGLSRTELFRRGLWQVAGSVLGERQPGSAIDYLLDTASDADVPRDLSERPDHYLYGGGYEAWAATQRGASQTAVEPRAPGQTPEQPDRRGE